MLHIWPRTGHERSKKIRYRIFTEKSSTVFRIFRTVQYTIFHAVFSFPGQTMTVFYRIVKPYAQALQQSARQPIYAFYALYASRQRRLNVTCHGLKRVFSPGRADYLFETVGGKSFSTPLTADTECVRWLSSVAKITRACMCIKKITARTRWAWR